MANQRNLILTICTGNICRSPIAEKLLQNALSLEAEPINLLEVVSAGVAAGYGIPASKNSITALKKVQIDLTRHKSQPVTEDLIERAFAIFGMTQSHLDALRYQYHDLPKRVHLFREFMKVDNEIEIPDPYGQNYTAYSECFDSMVKAIPSLVTYLKKEYKG
mgnify:FL=1